MTNIQYASLLIELRNYTPFQIYLDEKLEELKKNRDNLNEIELKQIVKQYIEQETN